MVHLATTFDSMFQFATSALMHLLTMYGYWAVLLFVAIESTGIPFPGETMLLAAVLRAWAAFLAGTNRMRWPRFLLFNALGELCGQPSMAWQATSLAIARIG